MLLKGDPWRHKAGCAVRTSQISKSLLIDWAGEAARGSLRVKSPLSATSGSNNIVRLSNATAGSSRPRNCRETPQVNSFETDYSAVVRKRKLICLLAFYWGFPRVSHARVVASAKAGGSAHYYPPPLINVKSLQKRQLCGSLSRVSNQ
jgi:hypothetical protein